MVYYYEYKIEDKKSDKEERTHKKYMYKKREWYFGERGG